MSSTQWSKPQDLDDATVVFGSRIGRLMPPQSDIPEEFKVGFGRPGSWVQFQTDWFFSGLRDVTWEPREGIDARQAARHLGAIQGSLEPKHEHKQSAVAYLASLWFVRVTANQKVYGETVEATA